ncbi:uncharacterized protein EV422DRAFT_62908 [Fimicolochytrium jonesii]|uniref:uncharacterized protein n=1 Tax=Fimicolochytrium jonesii TaxID=1396493 RepID=UPI0022FEF40E|nr:uncharacterized protein EV422DRAFT_62908 [Fimicolochytrium jonesii]KAI8820779.1 hypothetical protein EV422DRAFT_62908 [Fimicolochytrium jonesii]
MDRYAVLLAMILDRRLKLRLYGVTLHKRQRWQLSKTEICQREIKQLLRYRDASYRVKSKATWFQQKMRPVIRSTKRIDEQIRRLRGSEKTLHGTGLREALNYYNVAYKGLKRRRWGMRKTFQGVAFARWRLFRFVHSQRALMDAALYSMGRITHQRWASTRALGHTHGIKRGDGEWTRSLRRKGRLRGLLQYQFNRKTGAKRNLHPEDQRAISLARQPVFAFGSGDFSRKPGWRRPHPAVPVKALAYTSPLPVHHPYHERAGQLHQLSSGNPRV